MFYEFKIFSAIIPHFMFQIFNMSKYQFPFVILFYLKPLPIFGTESPFWIWTAMSLTSCLPFIAFSFGKCIVLHCSSSILLHKYIKTVKCCSRKCSVKLSLDEWMPPRERLNALRGYWLLHSYLT